jgi:hypothetical protein
MTKARGSAKVKIGGEDYLVFPSLEAIAKTEADCGFVTIIQIKQGLAYKSSQLILIMLKHCLEAAGYPVDEVKGIVKNITPDEIEPIRLVLDAISEPLFPKKKDEDEAETASLDL